MTDDDYSGETRDKRAIYMSQRVCTAVCLAGAAAECTVVIISTSWTNVQAKSRNTSVIVHLSPVSFSPGAFGRE
jgi:hypothetical protein